MLTRFSIGMQFNGQKGIGSLSSAVRVVPLRTRLDTSADVCEDRTSATASYCFKTVNRTLSLPSFNEQLHFPHKCPSL